MILDKCKPWCGKWNYVTPKGQTVPHAIVVNPRNAPGAITFYLRLKEAVVDGGGQDYGRSVVLAELIKDWTTRLA